MTKDIWINLPVNNVKKAKDFFMQIGFTLNSNFPENENTVSFMIGEKNVVIMLFEENTFKKFSQHELADTQQHTEVLFSIDAESPEEVDAFAQNVEKAGGNLFSKPQWSQGWMYGCAFADLDGHRWNMVFMDHSKMG